MTTCATCGIDLSPVSLYTAVLVTDMDETGTTVTMLFGRVCGDAAALLAPAATRSHKERTGKGAPVRDGRGAKPIKAEQRPVVDPATDNAPLAPRGLPGEGNPGGGPLRQVKPGEIDPLAPPGRVDPDSLDYGPPPGRPNRPN